MTDKAFVLSKVPVAFIGNQKVADSYSCNFYFAPVAGSWQIFVLSGLCRTENEAWEKAKQKIENTAHIDHYLRRAIQLIE